MLRFLADENIFPSSLQLIRTKGHDVLDIKEANFNGITDAEVIQLARKEDRILLTLDMHFTNIFLFPPFSNPGNSCCSSEACSSGKGRRNRCSIP